MSRGWASGCQVGVLVLLGLFGSRWASGSDLSSFLHSVFDEQYQRSPSGSDLYYQAGIYRDQGPLENYIAIYSSNEFYINQAHQDPATYIASLYQTFLGRSPRPDELNFWVTQFQQSGVRRDLFVRRFCEANRITQLPSFLPTQPAFQAPTSGPEIATQLVSRVELFIKLVWSELGNSVYGQSLTNRARQLLATAQQYRQVVFSSQRTPEQVRIASDNMNRTLLTLQQEFHRLPGVSSQCQTVLDQISRLVEASYSAIDARGQAPARPVVPGAVTALLESTRKFAYGLQGYQYQSPFYVNLVRDVQGLSVQVESLVVMIQQRQSARNVQQAMTEIMNHAGHIAQEIRQADMQVQRGWFNVSNELRRAAQSLNLRSDYYFQPSSPVVIHQPAWGQLPYQPGSPYPSNRNEECIREADQLLSRIDGDIASLRPIAYSNRNAANLIAALQDLRHATLAFRQTASSGAVGNAMARASDVLMAQYQQTAQMVTQMVARDPSLNSPSFYQIGEQVQRLRYTARGANIVSASTGCFFGKAKREEPGYVFHESTNHDHPVYHLRDGCAERRIRSRFGIRDNARWRRHSARCGKSSDGVLPRISAGLRGRCCTAVENRGSEPGRGCQSVLVDMSS